MGDKRVVGAELLRKFKREKYCIEFFNLGIKEYIASIDTICEMIDQLVKEEDD